RLLIWWRPHVLPGVRDRVVEPRCRFLELNAAAPLIAVPERSAGEAHEATIGDVERVRAIDTADPGRRPRWKALLPFPRVEGESKRAKGLWNSVVAGVVYPSLREWIVVAAPLVGEVRYGRALARALLDPLIDRVLGPVDRFGRVCSNRSRHD